jgi:hypothetical protein
MACQYLSDSKGQPKETLARIVTFYIPISKVYRNAARRKGTYLDPRVLGTIRKRSSELDRTGLLPPLPNQTLKEQRFARTDRADDRNDLPFRNSHVGLRNLEHLLRLVGGKGSGRTKNRTGCGGDGRIRVRFRFLLALLVFLRVLLVLVFSLAFALCTLRFWRRSIPGKRSAVHLESVVKFEVLRLFIGQGLSNTS